MKFLSTTFASPLCQFSNSRRNLHLFRTLPWKYSTLLPQTEPDTETLNKEHRKSRQENINVRALIIGAPGAGKGTQAQLLQKHFNVLHISSGNILMGEVLAGTRLGTKLKSCMDRGQLVVDKIVMKLMENRLTKEDCKYGYLMEGFPRNMLQAKKLDTILAKSNTDLDLVIKLDINQNFLFERVNGRLMHFPSGRTYHVHYNPPKVPMTDDITGQSLEKRLDDCLEVFKERLDIYNAETEPLVDYYEEKGVLMRVDASLSPLSVFYSIEKLIHQAHESRLQKEAQI